MKNLLCLLLLGILILGFCSVTLATEKELIIFAHGKSNIYIDLSIDKFPGGRHHLNTASIADFKHYFKEITRKELLTTMASGLIPIRAEILSPQNAAKLKNSLRLQDCIIDVSRDGIVLSASDSLGIINGLYTILDDWGCRWVLPGEMGEVIPKKNRLTLPLGRQIIRTGMDSRVDSSWRQGKDHPDWRRRNRRAAKQWLTGQHYWLYAIPPKIYFKEHPEYYSLIGGKRVPRQLCTTNPEVRKLMVEKALAYLKKHPNIASFPMDPADNYDHCQCENCKKLDNPGEISKGHISVSNRVAAFANYVAERIEKKYPDKKIGFYAYSNKKLPPTIKLHKNIFVPYTRDSSSLLHLMPDTKVPSSIEYWKMLKKWQKVCPNMYIYEYDPISWTGSLPCPIYLERARALKKQYAMGIKGAINDQGPRGDATLFVNRYMAARFKTNPKLDPEKELADICNNFFGIAGKTMNEYYLTLAKVTECKNDLRFGIAGYDHIFTPAIVKGARKYLDQALAIGKKSGNAMLQKRLKMVNLSQNYLEKYMQFIWNLQKRDYKQSQDNASKIFEAIDALAKENKNYLEPVDARRRLNTAVKKNMAKIFFKEMGFIRNWKVIGLFDNSQHDGIVVAKPLTYKNGKLYVDNKVVKARSYTSPEGFIDFREAFKKERIADNFYYAYATTVVNSAVPRLVQLRTDSINPFKIWLNGRLVYKREGPDADCPDKRKVNTRLRAGKNRIVVMVAEGSILPMYRWGFWLRITDAKGKLIDLKKVAEAPSEEQAELKAALLKIKTGKLKNLVPHPTFEGLSNLTASSFGVWPPTIKSKVSLDKTKAHSGKSSVKFINITSGCLNRFFKVKPGEKYLVGFYCYNEGESVCNMAVSWRGKGKFLASSLKRNFFPSRKGKWEQIVGIVTVPSNADQLGYAIAVSGQGAKDSCFVDDLMLYKLK